MIVSGVGQKNCQKASESYFIHSQKKREETWVNLGIAGHKDWPINSLKIVNEVCNEQSGWQMKLSPPEKFEGDAALLTTVDKVQEEFKSNSLYDMEGACFVETVSEFTAIPNIHLLKIVSDNQAQPFRQISFQKVYDNVKSNIKKIDFYLKIL